MYQNQDGEDVQWQFLGLHDLTQLDDSRASGAEVYSWSPQLMRDPLGRCSGDLDSADADHPVDALFARSRSE